jgi:hypothetical protein
VSRETDLEEHRGRIRACKEELQDIDFVLRGTILKRYMACGSKGCRCMGDPPVLHGPYYNWTRKVDGKTVTVRLSEEEATILQEWIDNARKYDEVVSRMVRITLEAVEKIRS